MLHIIGGAAAVLVLSILLAGFLTVGVANTFLYLVATVGWLMSGHGIGNQFFRLNALTLTTIPVSLTVFLLLWPLANIFGKRPRWVKLLCYVLFMLFGFLIFYLIGAYLTSIAFQNGITESDIQLIILPYNMFDWLLEPFLTLILIILSISYGRTVWSRLRR